MPDNEPSEFAQRLRERLQLPLPGEVAQFLMAPVGRPNIKPVELAQSTYSHSAVMILLCREESGSHVIPLIERTSYPGVHSGQVALPGGKFDPADVTFENTARRECQEEIGTGGDCELLGELSPLYIPVSRHLVHPFVGYYNSLPPLKPDPREVSQIIPLGIDALLDTRTKTTGSVAAGGVMLDVPCYSVKGCTVWGATAMILSELREVLS